MNQVKTYGAVAINSIINMDYTLNPYHTVADECEYIKIIDLSNQFNMFYNLVSDHGIELPYNGYIKLFQLYVEIIIDFQHSSPYECLKDVRHLILLEMLTNELSSESHSDSLSEFSKDDDTIVEVNEIAIECGLFDIEVDAVIDGRHRMVHAWLVNKNEIKLHLGMF